MNTNTGIENCSVNKSTDRVLSLKQEKPPADKKTMKLQVQQYRKEIG
ncbi:MAG: hypothetical protein U9R02_14900 [Thermodesulfobacteriota bacterium]|nr:hypothetical protein [Thermodesulfobacteriota bacterium]